MHPFIRHGAWLLLSFAVNVSEFVSSNSYAQQFASAGPLFLNEIVIRVEPSARPNGLEIIQGVADRDPGPLQRTGSPVHARYLISLRILPTFLAMMPRDDPRVGLHGAIVLRYASAGDTESAEARLRADPSVISLLRGTAMRFAVPPNDPLLIPTSNIAEFQWAADRLNLFDAWRRTRGSAYVADLDNGIQVSGLAGNLGLHADLAGNYRAQFSRNFDLHNKPFGASNTSDNLDEEPYTNSAGTNVAGHGSHTAGLIAAAGNNSIGVAGVCYNCSLMLGRVSTWLDDPFYGAAYGGYVPSAPAVTDGVYTMTNSGTQVINESFGVDSAGCTYPGATGTVCAALDAAAAHDVAVVAAAGNFRQPNLQFPASYGSVIAAVGAQYDTSGGVAFWEGSGNFGSNWSTSGNAYAAPSLDVISSVYTGTDWNPGTQYRCGDNFPSASYALGYGDCTGTSMAAPHISGIVALMRSTQPTLSVAGIKSIISANTTACNGASGYKCGTGVPNAGKAVQSALGGAAAINRLTPLFSFYSDVRTDHVYTVVPQMGTAAILGTLVPLTYTGNQFSYGSIGPLTAGYSAFPGVPLTGCGFSPPCDPLYPRAMLSVFTTFRDPRGGLELAPLYREL